MLPKPGTDNQMDAAGNLFPCPNCGKSMQLARVTPRFGGLPELQTFECRGCRVALTEAVDESSTRAGTKQSGA